MQIIVDKPTMKTINTYGLRPRETVCFVDPPQLRVHKTYCFPEISVNKYFIIYQESKKRNNKANFVENT